MLCGSAKEIAGAKVANSAPSGRRWTVARRIVVDGSKRIW